jgi:hypothetical protein
MEELTNKENKKEVIENKKKNKKIISRIILSTIVATLLVVLFNYRYAVGIIPELSSLTGWSLWVLNIAFFFVAFGIILLISGVKAKTPEQLKEIEAKEKERQDNWARDQWRNEKINLIISIIMTAAVYYFNDLTWLQTVLAFGVTYVFCEACSYMTDWRLESIATFGYRLLVKVCIPSMLIVIIILGSINGMYPREGATFLSESEKAISHAGVVLGDGIARGVNQVLEVLYNLGFNQPMLFLLISLGAIAFMMWGVARESFVPPEKTSEQKTAQELIDETIDGEKEEAEDKAAREKRLAEGVPTIGDKIYRFFSHEDGWWENLAANKDAKLKEAQELNEQASADAKAKKIKVEFKS